MKYVANPVVVDAFKIVEVGPLQTLADQSEHFRVLLLEDQNVVAANAGMLARYTPIPGDYWVIQTDGYVYLNPKEVFERKYRPLEQQEEKRP